jgi:hypothetical protein
MGLILGLGLFGSDASAQGNDVIWVLFPYGARAAGMGKAFTAEGEGVQAIHWNPAGLARLESSQLLLSHMENVVDHRVEFLSFATPGGEWGNFAFGMYLDHLGEDIPETDAAGEVLGKLGVWDFFSSISYATDVSDDLEFGANLKLLMSKLADVVGYSTAFDVGLRWHATSKMALAMTLRNQGPKFQYIDAYQADPIAGRAVVGARYEILDDDVNRWIVTGDLYKSTTILDEDADLQWREIKGYLGTEFTYLTESSSIEALSLRGGYIWERDVRSGGRSYSYGLGFQWGNAAFDLAVVDDNDLDLKQLFTISWGF